MPTRSSATYRNARSLSADRPHLHAPGSSLLGRLQAGHGEVDRSPLQLEPVEHVHVVGPRGVGDDLLLRAGHVVAVQPALFVRAEDEAQAGIARVNPHRRIVRRVAAVRLAPAKQMKRARRIGHTSDTRSWLSRSNARIWSSSSGVAGLVDSARSTNSSAGALNRNAARLRGAIGSRGAARADRSAQARGVPVQGARARVGAASAVYQ